MRAVIYERYGPPDVLQVREVPEPARRPGHARVEVHAAALNPKDILVRKGKMRWLVGRELPRTPGYDFAGVLLEDADGISTGSRVFGMVNAQTAGACAEQVSVPFDELAVQPEGLSMVEAAALPLAGLTALQALRDELRLQPGACVLLNGASGGVGTLAVQMARALGAAEVLAVCSGRNRELVEGLGATRVIDYGRESLDDAGGLDAAFDIFGTLPYERAKKLLQRGGRYCTTIPAPGAMLREGLRRVGLGRAALVVVHSRRRDLEQIRAWVEAGTLRPLVDRVVALEESAEGHRYLETRRARGKVVVRLR